MSRHKCRYSFCPNYYDDVIGGDGAFGKKQTGACCVPCLYAQQMVEHEQTIEQVESVPHLQQMFLDLLDKTGWTWEDMKASFERMQANKASAEFMN